MPRKRGRGPVEAAAVKEEIRNPKTENREQVAVNREMTQTDTDSRIYTAKSAIRVSDL